MLTISTKNFANNFVAGYLPSRGTAGGTAPIFSRIAAVASIALMGLLTEKATGSSFIALTSAVGTIFFLALLKKRRQPLPPITPTTLPTVQVMVTPSFLPSEVFLKIFSYLKRVDLCAVSQVNREWQVASNANWHLLYLQNFGDPQRAIPQRYYTRLDYQNRFKSEGNVRTAKIRTQQDWAFPSICRVVFSPLDNSTLLACDEAGKMHFWQPDAPKDKQQEELESTNSACIKDIIFPNGYKFFSFATKSRSHRWKSYREWSVIFNPSIASSAALASRIRVHCNLTLSCDGKQLATVSSADAKHINLWDIREILNPQKLAEYKIGLSEKKESEAGICALTFSSDSYEILAFCQDSTLYTIDLKTNLKTKRSWPNHSSPPYVMEWNIALFSAGGRRLAVPKYSRSPHISDLHIWNLETNASQVIRIDLVACLAFSPNGHSLAIGCVNDKIYILDVITKKLSLLKQVCYTSLKFSSNIDLHHYAMETRNLSFSADGTKLVSASEDGVHLYHF